MNLNHIPLLRLRRQALATPVTGAEYDELFRAMSPVHTLYWTEPGAPPLLQRRAAFDDLLYNDGRRAARAILKGRYQNGSVGYVDRRDLALYVCAYRKPIEAFSFEELTLFDLLSRSGPLSIGEMKQITGMLVKKITPVLHRLQQAFLVFEDQSGGEGYRPWYVFETEFPEVDLNEYGRIDAIKQIILRFLPLMVCADAGAIKSFYGFSARDITQALTELIEDSAVKTTAVNGVMCYYLSCDEGLLSGAEETLEPPSGVFLLHRSDFWVKAEEPALKQQFSSQGAGVLYYIVIDGVIRGAVTGHFKFGPHIIEDVLTDLSEEEKTARREEILEAIYAVFDRFQSPVMRYDGEPLP